MRPTLKLLRNTKVSTRFPTKYNPVRSAFNQKIILPEGVNYNPAPSAPNPLDTPAAFLPQEERQTRSFLKDDKEYDTSSMPPLGAAPLRTYHLTKEDTIEIQRLRQLDPYKNTRKALAKQFKVSEYVISLVSNPNADHQTDMLSRLDMIREQWTERRERAREQKIRRKKFWLRDA